MTGPLDRVDRLALAVLISDIEDGTARPHHFFGTLGTRLGWQAFRAAGLGDLTVALDLARTLHGPETRLDIWPRQLDGRAPVFLQRGTTAPEAIAVLAHGPTEAAATVAAALRLHLRIQDRSTT